MKRFYTIIALSMVLVLMIPRYNVLAYDGQDIVIRTTESNPDIDSSTLIGNAQKSTIFDDVTEGSGYTQGIIQALNDFDWDQLSDYQYYVITSSWSSGSGENQSFYLEVLGFNSTLQPFIVSRNYDMSHYNMTIYAASGSAGALNDCRFYYNSWSDVWNSSATSFNDQPMNGYATRFGRSSCLDCNVPIVSYKEAEALYDPNTEITVNNYLTSGGWENCTDLFTGLKGYNLDGDIVDGSGAYPDESNANHMYFQNCELGFATPQNASAFYTYGGAYAYVRYTVDDWVVDHIADYEIVLNAEAQVAYDSAGGSFVLPLDRDGCVEIPFSDLFSDDNVMLENGFIAAVSNTTVEDIYKKTYLYSVSNSRLQSFVERNNSTASTNTISELWKLLKQGALGYIMSYVKGGFTGFFNDYVDSLIQNIVVQYNPYVITLSASLRTKDLENHSGTFSQSFNLVTGNTNTEETSGLQNDDPYNPPENPDDPQTPDIPDGNSTYPVVVVENGGSWTGSLSAAFDPGYRELKQDIDSDPDGNFTQYLAPFENNDAGDFFMGFINGMPDTMKTIFISGFGVLTLLGIYRFIRRG